MDLPTLYEADQYVRQTFPNVRCGGISESRDGLRLIFHVYRQDGASAEVEVNKTAIGQWRNRILQSIRETLTG